MSGRVGIFEPRSPRRWRHISASLMVLVIFPLLASCVQNTSPFDVPAVWAQPTYSGYVGPLPALALLENGAARVRDFPIPTSSPSGTGTPTACWNGASLFSGPATWKMKDADTLVVSFGGSSVEMWPSVFVDEDWSSLEFGCDPGRHSLGWVCGRLEGREDRQIQCSDETLDNIFSAD